MASNAYSKFILQNKTLNNNSLKGESIINQKKYKCSEIKTLFLGDLPDYNMLPLKEGINVSAKDIAQLIAERNNIKTK